MNRMGFKQCFYYHSHYSIQCILFYDRIDRFAMSVSAVILEFFISVIAMFL